MMSAKIPWALRQIRNQSSWQTSIKAAEDMVRVEVKKQDPFSIVSNEMSTLAKNIARIVGSGHPTLNRVSSYYFEADGKKIRPLIVLLLSRAVACIPESKRDRIEIDRYDVLDQKEYEGTPKSMLFAGKSALESISPLNILHGINPSLVLNPLTRANLPLPEFEDPAVNNEILPKQRRLAEVVEMIHTASLLHDDVIDFSDSRRGRPSGNVAFTNKMAILAGDFLLGRASVELGRLRNSEVVELMSTSIANLVEGEFMQLKNTVLQPDITMVEGNPTPIPEATGKVPTEISEYSVPGAVFDGKRIITHEENVNAAFDYYLHKTYLKTAALISKSSRSTAILAGCQEEVINNCYRFGRNLGLCFQIVDDMLDYTTTAEQLGKPAGADLQLGLATAPILYAWKNDPSLGPLIARNFSKPGDVETAKRAVIKNDGVEKTRVLASKYRDQALEALRTLPESGARSVLEFVTNSVLTRTK
ncbi:BA75_04488T0 [Komagataella pastoris]|uniref:BA75_04488T0 n=1 Tax=Komagataella pastoris TaxID=4922 RepID=A0A1B2JHY5_PICPA|nr:BA75_04488T0 [Komagataella pastoris]